MRILIVSSYLPYPLTSGGHIRLFNIIAQLSKKHEIVLVCEKRPFQTTADVDVLKQFCKTIITFPRKKQWSISNIVKTALSQDSFLINGHTNLEMKHRLERLLEKEQFDLIHVETSYVMQNIPETSIPIVLTEHNIEYFVYQRFVQKVPFFLQPFLNYDISKLKKREKSFWKRANQLVTVSEEEKKEIGLPNVSVVPNGVDVNNFKFQISNFKFEIKEKKVLFIGDFKWLQNRDSARFIIKDVWPSFAKAMAGKPTSEDELSLWIVGKKIPDSIKELSDDKSIIFDENAPIKTSDIYKESFILLAPIRIGGGTSFKILEAMASGVPVVTTTLGAEGIAEKSDNALVIADTADEIRDAILRLNQDKIYYTTISKNARKCIEKNYTWPDITGKLEKIYLEAI